MRDAASQSHLCREMLEKELAEVDMLTDCSPISCKDGLPILHMSRLDILLPLGVQCFGTHVVLFHSQCDACPFPSLADSDPLPFGL